MPEKTYSITELTDLTDVTERTVRYYITLGLLPKPEGVGRWSHYTEEHLNRLTLIRKLQEGHMPLSEIGEFIKALDAQEAEAKASQRRGFGEKFRKKGKGEKAGAEKTEPEADAERRGQRRGGVGGTLVVVRPTGDRRFDPPAGPGSGCWRSRVRAQAGAPRAGRDSRSRAAHEVGAHRPRPRRGAQRQGDSVGQAEGGGRGAHRACKGALPRGGAVVRRRCVAAPRPSPRCVRLTTA